MRFYLSICIVISLLLPVTAQQPETDKAFNPAVAYFDSFILNNDADKLLKDDKVILADEKYRRSLRLLRSIQIVHPDYEPEMIADKIKSTEKAVFNLEKPVAEAFSKLSEQQGDIVAETAIPQVPTVERSSITQRRKELDGLYKQIRSLRLQLQKSEKNRTADRAKLRTTLRQLEAERARKANAPIRAEIASLRERLRITEQERDAMTIALKKSRAEHRQAMAKIETLRADQQLDREKIANLERDIKSERTVNNDLVHSLRSQHKNLINQLNEKELLLERSQEDILELKQQLNESHAIVDELKTERDSLLVERNKMSDLLALSDKDRAQELIRQNMQLSKQLIEAKNRVELLSRDGNNAKNELIAAKQDLALSKTRLKYYLEQSAEQNERIVKYEQKLIDLKADLDNIPEGESHNDASAQELAIVREVAQRLLRKQQVRKKASDLLVKRAKDLGVLTDLIDPIQALAGPDIQLDEEEEKLVNAIPGDAVDFFDVAAAPVEVRKRAERRLAEKINGFARVGARAFMKKRFIAAAEVFELILEEHPGHVETLLNLGVVSLAQEDYTKAIDSFRSAIAMRESVPYAHRQLGVSYYKNNQPIMAREALLSALEIDSEDAITHTFLGNIAGQNNQFSEAEDYFKKAIAIDPRHPEPFLNMAKIHASKAQYKEARKMYELALENGAQVDNAFQNTLR